MTEYNFVPDYKKWWNKKTLSQDDLCWLLVGIDPKDAKKSNDLWDSTLNRTDEEKLWVSNFSNYLDLSPFGSWSFNKHSSYKKMLIWNGDKITFIKNAYDNRISFPEEFLEFLVSSKSLSKNEDLERYKDYDLYKAKEIKPEEIQSEDEALSLLLGLEPKYLLEFSHLRERIANEPKDTNGFVAYVRFSPKEKWFFSEYKTFIENSFYGSSAQAIICNAIKSANKYTKWNGSFEDYVQQLHNAGFIFRDDTYEKIGIKPVYAQDSWAIQFYKYWLKQGGWTLEESVSLFKGQDPRGERRSIIDLSQNPYILSYSKNSFLSWDKFEGEYISLDKRLARYVTVGGLESYQYTENDKLYNPKAIVNWLQDNTSYLPPKALLEAMGHNELVEYQKTELSKVQENQTTTKSFHEVSLKLKQQLDAMYGDAMLYWDDFIEKNKTEPTKAYTAEFLAAKYNDKWSASSIERELSATKLKLRYQEYKATDSSKFSR